MGSIGANRGSAGATTQGVEENTYTVQSITSSELDTLEAGATVSAPGVQGVKRPKGDWAVTFLPDREVSFMSSKNFVQELEDVEIRIRGRR